MFFGRTPRMIRADEALPGRSTPLIPSEPHHVNDTPITPPFPTGSLIAVVAEGCFWGVERIFWSIPGVLTTAVGYAGGFTPNPTYEEVCTGATGHAEAVMVVFDPTIVSYDELLRTFWESHDPTQGMRQGNDLGTQYRSAIFTLDDDQYNRAIDSRHAYEQALQSAGRGVITTTIEPLGTFADDWFYAEDYHQQYLSKNPYGYCGVKGTGVACPVPGPTI